MTPARCGISDGALLLAGELEAAFGIKTAIAVLNSNEPCSLPLRMVHCAPAQLLEACLSLNENQPGHLLVHLSGYGYSPDGAPALLAEALRSVKADGRFRIAVFFHELFASGMPWESAFFHSWRQKKAIRGIAETCDRLVANTSYSVHWLEEKTARQSAAPIEYLPVFSQVGEAEQHIPLADREPAMVVFGLGGTRQRAYKELPGMRNALHQLGVREILDIGPEAEAPRQLDGIPVRRMGVLPAEEIAAQFSRTSFGFVSLPHPCLTKSGVFAGYCANGVIPVLARHFTGEIDGLKDGVQVLSPKTVRMAQATGLEQSSLAAWRWYAGHRLHVHAAAHARWLDEMASATY